MIKLEHTYESLPSEFYAKVEPELPIKAEFIRLNRGLLREFGWQDRGEEDHAKWLDICSGNVENKPLLAMVYAGHQFGHFVPSLGDGRALLLGEYVDDHEGRWDLQLKGSGRTPFSRSGDGKSWLGAVVREYIVSEGMYHQGIPTTRALSMIKTGEIVYRNGTEQGAILARVAKSHIRIGTFQYFAARRDKKSLMALLIYTCKRHDVMKKGDEPLWLALLRHVCQKQSDLIAKWMLVGFVHGVMNTDNMLISGETIDYGPCAFLDEFHPMKVFSSIDEQGRYAFGNQPSIGAWNVTRLADCFLFVEEDDALKATYRELAAKELSRFADNFHNVYQKGLKNKLGLAGVEKRDDDLMTDLLSLMAEFATDFTMTFRSLSNICTNHQLQEQPFLQHFHGSEKARKWLKGWLTRVGFTGVLDSNQQVQFQKMCQKMQKANPHYIPRNHQIAKVIDSLEAGDTIPLERLLFVLENPYKEQVGYADLAKPPEIHERVTRTFCGT